MAIHTSRSAIEFLRRSGLRDTPRVPMPRLDMLLSGANDIPLKRPQLNPNLMLDADGDVPPDRGTVDLFPPPQEVEPNVSEAEVSE